MSLKKFSQIKEERSKQKSTDDKGKAPRKYVGSSSEYEDITDQEILAKEFTKRSTDKDMIDKKSKKEVTIKDKKVMSNDISTIDKDGKKIKESNQVEIHGKVAKFPKNTKASKAYNFLENIKCNKSDIWYFIIEKQQTVDGSELQMVKYNQKMGVNLVQFINELKSYYISKYSDRKDLIKIFDKMEVVGEDKFSVIKNIPNLVVEGKRVITKITEDLTKLLGK